MKKVLLIIIQFLLGILAIYGFSLIFNKINEHTDCTVINGVLFFQTVLLFISTFIAYKLHKYSINVKIIYYIVPFLYLVAFFLLIYLSSEGYIGIYERDFTIKHYDYCKNIYIWLFS